MLKRLPVVAVLGSGAPIAPDRTVLAREIGALIAQRGAHLLTGGGFGVMAAAAEGFVGIEPRAGFSIGIVPRDPRGGLDAPNHAADGTPYPSPFVEIAVFSALPPRVPDWRTVASRNHVNVFSAHALVALPGAVGTANELAIAAAFAAPQGGGDAALATRPVLLVGPRAEFPADVLAQFQHAAGLAEAAPGLTAMIDSCARALHAQAPPSKGPA